MRSDICIASRVNPLYIVSKHRFATVFDSIEESSKNTQHSSTTSVKHHKISVVASYFILYYILYIPFYTLLRTRQKKTGRTCDLC